MKDKRFSNVGKDHGKLIKVRVLVYGGTVAGIGAALSAARMGYKTVLIERGSHFGGMTSSGLGAIDILRKNAVGGIFQEFIKRTQNYYFDKYGKDSEEYRLTYDGYFMEPHVAEQILEEMLSSQKNLTIFRRCELVEVIVEENAVIASVYRERDTGEQMYIEHEVAIDGTYEDDLAAAAGVEYKVGRESRKEYDEQFAGIIYYDWRFNRQQVHPQSTGEASPYIQAYCFRVTLSDDARVRIPFSKPESYSEFLPYYRAMLKDFECGRVRFLRELVWLNPISNRKYCANGHIEALTSMNLAEVNREWTEASWEKRDELFRYFKNYTIGFWYFLQNDPSIPYILRKEAQCFGLPPDEYLDCEHFPWQLYIREARRIVGEYVFTEHDCIPPPGRERPLVHRDSIAVCEHNFDSHPCRNRGKDSIVITDDGFELLEGTIWFRNKLKSINRPATIPYRCIVPRKIENILVPAALSASHVAFSALRMEPVWMALGQAAGIAAVQAISAKTTVRSINISELQRTLLAQGQVLICFDGLSRDDPNFRTIQLKGLEEDYPSFNLQENF